MLSAPRPEGREGGGSCSFKGRGGGGSAGKFSKFVSFGWGWGIFHQIFLRARSGRSDFKACTHDLCPRRAAGEEKIEFLMQSQKSSKPNSDLVGSGVLGTHERERAVGLRRPQSAERGVGPPAPAEGARPGGVVSAPEEDLGRGGGV